MDEQTLYAYAKYSNLLELLYNLNSYSKKVKELEIESDLLTEEIDKLFKEKIDLIYLKAKDKQQLIFEIYNKKLNTILKTGITLILVYVVLNSFLFSFIMSKMIEFIILILTSTIFITLLTIKIQKIEKKFCETEKENQKNFENTKSKEINDRIETIDKEIEIKKNKIDNNLMESKKISTEIKLINYYVNQMKQYKDKICKEDENKKIYTLNDEYSFKSKDKLKILK